MLVFIFSWILLLIISILTVLIFSTVRISIEKLEIKNKEVYTEKIDFDDLWKYLDINFSVKIGLYFLNTIKILQYKINKEKAKRLHIDEKIKSLTYEKVREEVSLDFDKDMLKKVKKLNFKIKKFDLNLKIGAKGPIATSYIVAIISIMVSIVLAQLIKKVNPNAHKYEITPLYVNKNKMKLNLNCIIYAELVHIIYVIFIFIRKRRVKIDERTSNRGIDDDSDGQYSGYGGRKYNNRRANTNI